MKTVYADRHALHYPLYEVDCGQVVECSEMPSRADNVHKAVLAAGLGPVLPVAEQGMDAVRRVHDAGYLEFLQTAHAEWTAAGLPGDAFATNFNMQHQSKTPPQAIIGKMGYYVADTSVCFTAGTWEVVKQSCDAALTALDLVLGGEKAAFSLSRPPGHHASAAAAAGYSYLNYAATATQAFLDRQGGKVAILDVDYHHGNGTQDIFYRRKDVLYCSLHADPLMDFPFFLGHANETGEGDGAGFNRNYPMPLGTDWARYGAALDDAIGHIEAYRPDLLIVSLGVDTYRKDPISKFQLDTPDYALMGAAIARLKMPALFIMEGGYNIDDIGVNIVNVLTAYRGR